MKRIRHLVRLMKVYDLTAIDIQEAGTKIRLRRRGADVPVVQAVGPVAFAQAPAAAALPAAPATPPPAAAPVGLIIESPMVGTFYTASSPSSPPFVVAGGAIRPETTVCVIEAMKVFTDIPAGVAGTILEVLAKNGQAVEFGQPLFRVNPA
ncbi:acetyl-CoA carboxylase biotin carboxyl carrier protein [Isosphaeraceae bacterium EP7]